MPRKSPIRHTVRSHTRKGKRVKSFTRGKGNRRRVSVRVNPVGKNISVSNPTEEELIERDWLWRTHSEMVFEDNPLALRMQDILERCYPPDPTVKGYRWDEMYQKWRDLYGAIMIDITPIGSPVTEGFENLALASAAFKKWDVEEAFYCEALRDIFTMRYRDEWEKWQ